MGIGAPGKGGRIRAASEFLRGGGSPRGRRWALSCLSPFACQRGAPATTRPLRRSRRRLFNLILALPPGGGSPRPGGLWIPAVVDKPPGTLLYVAPC